MIKDFVNWLKLKSDVHFEYHRPAFRERDIWWCKLGENIGDEGNGKSRLFSRPVLVVKKFNKNIFLGVPLSKQIKPDNKYYFTFNLHQEKRSALISQIRILDAKRINDKIGRISKQQFQKIITTIKQMF